MVLLVGLRGRDKVGTVHQGNVGTQHTAVRDSLGRSGQGLESQSSLLGLAGPKTIGRDSIAFEDISIPFDTPRKHIVEPWTK